MTANEAFRQLRINSGYTYRAFAVQAGIPLSLLYGYESGGKEISSIPVAKAVRIFSLCGKSVVAFYLENYNLQQEVLQNMEKWNREHPAELHLDRLMTQLKNRIAKSRERKRLTEETALQLNKESNNIKGRLKDIITEDGCISEKDYEQYVTPLMANIRAEMFCAPDNLPIENRLIIDAKHKKNWGYSDLAEICGLSSHHLKYCLTGNGNLYSMHIGTALKLCIALGLEFPKVFKTLDDNK